MTSTPRHTFARRVGRTAAATAAAAALTMSGAATALAAPADAWASAGTPTTSEEGTTGGWSVVVDDGSGQGQVAASGSLDEAPSWLTSLFGGDTDWSFSDLLAGGDDAAPASASPDALRSMPASPAPRASAQGSWGQDGADGTTSAPVPRTAAPAPEAAAPRSAAPPAPAPSSGGLSSGEQTMLDAVNSQRASVGCAPVSADPRLTAAARAHASDMVDREYFDHTGLDGSTPWDRAERAGTTANAENISAGQASGADAARDLWSSPGHRANIADCDLTKVGIGNDVGGKGSGATSGGTWVQLFAS